MSQQLQAAGMTIVQKVGPFVELYFDWSKLPQIDVFSEYFLVQVTPKVSTLPVEYGRPNSSGPLHFGLRAGAAYQVRLLIVPFFKAQVTSSFKPMPWVDVIPQHEGLHKLVWGNIDFHGLLTPADSDQLEVLCDGEIVSHQSVEQQPEAWLKNRPQVVQLRLHGGAELFECTTNLDVQTLVAELEITLEDHQPSFYFNPVVQTADIFSLRGEIEPFHDMKGYFLGKFQEKFPDVPLEQVGGELVFFEDEKQVSSVRTWGFGLSPNRSVIESIQTKEWGLSEPKKVDGFRLSLEITTRHREFYKQKLIEKTFGPDEPLCFTDAEVVQARETLFRLHPHAFWDQSFIELVAHFEVEGKDAQEFQREPAHVTRWDWQPGNDGEVFSAQWTLFSIEDAAKRLVLFASGPVHRDHFAPKVVLKPFSDREVMVWWQLEQKGVTQHLQGLWGVGLDQVGFYLKLHEEYLGNRVERPDLEVQLADCFSPHPCQYLTVEPNRCFSAEIVARHFEHEVALTPVSTSLVTPRTLFEAAGTTAPERSLGASWHHTTQREVRHQNGHDSSNKAKVLLHLHMHSPNLFRVEPFRESYLKDVVWPVQTAEGTEVHNVPGEWALKNCLDSWLPLLRVFRTLAEEGVDFQVSLDISPPVAYMINHPRFKDYLSRYLARSMAHTEGQIALMKSKLESPAYIWAAQRYLDGLKGLDHFYHQVIQKDMIAAFRQLELSGFLELSTCTATHGMAACLESMPDSLDAQIALAARSHHRIFGDRPRGIWLAENSCFPGVDRFLEKEDLHYYFVEAEAVLGASARPKSEEFNPLVLPGSNVVAFGRSRMGRIQVWDAKIGYAGHPEFREYHHRHWGLPLKKITSKVSEEKHPYNPDRAIQVAQELAQDFYKKLLAQAETLSQWDTASQPLITCTYDAELFGHHWFEGPIFLEELLREFHRSGDKIGLTSPSHYLSHYPKLPEAQPNPSTWGHEACHVRWTDPKVAWTQRELQRCDSVLNHYLELCHSGELTGYFKSCVEQMGAELMRAESSDLTFVIISGDFEEDMQREILKYLDYFYRLKSLVDQRCEDQDFLAFRQYENDMFPEIGSYYQLD